jgi:hypothetical protein
VIISRTSHIDPFAPTNNRKNDNLRRAIKVCTSGLETHLSFIAEERKKSVAAASQGFNHLVQHSLLTGDPISKGNNSASHRVSSLSIAQIGGVYIYTKRVFSQMDKMSS